MPLAMTGVHCARTVNSEVSKGWRMVEASKMPDTARSATARRGVGFSVGGFKGKQSS